MDEIIKEIEQTEAETSPKKESQHRCWIVVVNNPKQTETEFSDYLKGLNHIKYFTFCREKAETGTEHYQCYIEFSQPKRFSVTKNIFSAKTIGVNAHIDGMRGTKKEARDYAQKIGDYADQAGCKIGIDCEFGRFVDTGERSDLADIVELMANGATIAEIKRLYAANWFRYSKTIEKLRADYLLTTVNHYRELTITYMYGETRCGKTKHIMKKHGPNNVFRMIKYGFNGNPVFDGYNEQKVMLFDEFRSSIDFSEMLVYTDCYISILRARYNDKVSCYDTVYIVSNIPLEDQYKNIRVSDYKSWAAFKARINYVWDMDNQDEPQPLHPPPAKSPLQDKPVKLTVAQLIPIEDDGELPF